jgi:hypothetical protein
MRDPIPALASRFAGMVLDAGLPSIEVAQIEAFLRQPDARPDVAALVEENARLRERVVELEAEARHLRGGFTDAEIDEITAAGAEACNRYWENIGSAIVAALDSAEREDVMALLRGDLEREDYLPAWIAAVEEAAETVRNRNRSALDRARKETP